MPRQWGLSRFRSRRRLQALAFLFPCQQVQEEEGSAIWSTDVIERGHGCSKTWGCGRNHRVLRDMLEGRLRSASGHWWSYLTRLQWLEWLEGAHKSCRYWWVLQTVFKLGKSGIAVMQPHRWGGKFEPCSLYIYGLLFVPLHRPAIRTPARLCACPLQWGRSSGPTGTSSHSRGRLFCR